jgi:adenine-specific DNA-methyltransferase
MKKPAQREHVGRASALLDAERLAGLRDLYPEAFAESKVDFDKLRGLLGGEIDERPERYSFTWAGKRDAIRILQTPSRATLLPCPEESIDFETSRNVFIEGENLEVLKLLYKSYFGRVKMIYIDPPYNTGHDFIYPDNYADPLATYLQLTGQQDSAGNLLTSNPETSGRYHSAWLSMMYPRLFLARQLLRDDGIIFVSIDDHEVDNLRRTMNEIFGEENFVGTIVVQLNPRGRHLDKFIAKTHEYIVSFARDATQQPTFAIEKDDRMLKEYDKEDERGRYRELELRNRNPSFNSRTRPNLFFPLYVDPTTGRVSAQRGKVHTVEVLPRNSTGGDSCWTWSMARAVELQHLLLGSRTRDGSWRIFRKDYLFREDGTQARTLPKALWLDREINNDVGKKALQELFEGKTLFDFPKSPFLMAKLLSIGTQDGDLALDFFAGSCPLAQAVLEGQAHDLANRQFVMVQLPEPTPEGSEARDAGFATIADIGKERIRRVVAKLKTQKASQLPLDARAQPEDLGFRVFKLTLSNFAPWTGQAPDAEAYIRQLEFQKDPLIEGWKPQDVIWEVALREGFGLDAQVVPVAGLEALAVWRVTDPAKEQSFFLCLADRIDLAALRPLNLGKEDLFICRDAALDDEAAANLALQCRLKTI